MSALKLSSRTFLMSFQSQRFFSSLLVKAGRMYNARLDLKVGAMALSAQNFLDLASMDAQAQSLNVEDYLATVKSNAANFIKGDEFHDRKQLVKAVSDVITTEGKFGLLLGGKSTGLLCDVFSCIKYFYLGKSFLLKHLQRSVLDKQKDRFVVVFDGRASAGNLQLAIKEGLETVSLFHKYKDIAQSLLRILVKVIPTVASSMSGTGDSIPTEIESLKKIIKILQDKHFYPVFLFDEANSLLTSKPVLEYLVKCTKETHEATVLLASSEYSFPFRLKQLGFNLNNVTTTIFAGEVPPLDMLDLLQNKWGMGSNLAEAFVNVYGGHIQLASFGVSDLALNREDFMPRHALPVDVYEGIVQCIEAENSGRPEMNGIVDILRMLAVRGFVPLLKASDLRAEFISSKAGCGWCGSRCRHCRWSSDICLRQV